MADSSYRSERVARAFSGSPGTYATAKDFASFVASGDGGPRGRQQNDISHAAQHRPGLRLALVPAKNMSDKQFHCVD